MIQEMETLLKHWGEQTRRCGSAGGLGSPMATIMEWGGCAPRSTPGSRILLDGGAGIDSVAQEVAAALAEVSRQDERGQMLERLAVLRYTDDTAPTWLMQLHLVGSRSRAKQTYYDQVHSLHLRLLQVLNRRLGTRRSVVTGQSRQPDCNNHRST
ncbi:hypothetical protein [Pseudomonas sp. B14(2022)]|uniref:hypothetical protein n=1 Tax=Pseudomonas sp. B14(2022) TaxID=2914043 RepID=UPI00142F6C9F|nr:hypothetical protein [Pseudomonas sp. B14(2022)]NJJ60281.1 hypothetical protein [Pseudomonas sp. B14(2022)]